MNVPVPRRRQPWGAIWAKAPWDGKHVEVETPRIPATLAAPTLATSNVKQTHRRQSFGHLLQTLPWSGVKKPADIPNTVDTLSDFPVDSVANEDTTLEIV